MLHQELRTHFRGDQLDTDVGVSFSDSSGSPIQRETGSMTVSEVFLCSVPNQEGAILFSLCGIATYSHASGPSLHEWN